MNLSIFPRGRQGFKGEMDKKAHGHISKGQIISDCLFDVLNFPKTTTKKVDKFLPLNLKSGQINKIEALSYDTIIYT